jgi:general secretion pathway protein E
MSSSAAIAVDILDKALVQARGGPRSDGSVWLGLKEVLAVEDDDLAKALLDEHGVAVIADADWASAEILQDVAEVGRLVRIGETSFLLSGDPWAPKALQAHARVGQASLRLALARPGQTTSSTKTQVSAPGRKDGVDGETTAPAFIDMVISRAYLDGASDVHFETCRQGIGVKYRLDGVMAAGPRLDNVQRAEEVISRIKVLAHLDITERRRPQDGRIHWQGASGEAVDLRVSIMPSIFGEDAVLRLLDKAQLRSKACP